MPTRVAVHNGSSSHASYASEVLFLCSCNEMNKRKNIFSDSNCKFLFDRKLSPQYLLHGKDVEQSSLTLLNSRKEFM